MTFTFHRSRATRAKATAETNSTATITNLSDRTTLDRRSGAVHSVQVAQMTLTESALEQLWSPPQLERLARTYWRFLTRVTLGLVRVHYTAQGRFVVLLGKPLKLLTFSAPEYELDAQRALVRWRIERGLLVAKAGHDGEGHLQIELRREPGPDSPETRESPESPESPPSLEHVRIEVEVANFYPAIAFTFSKKLYEVTQSKIHVIVTKGFLRSLAKLDFPRSRVGRFEP